MGNSTRFFRAVLSPDGSRLASAHRPEHALVWDVTSGALLYGLDRKGSVAGLEFDAEGRRLALATRTAPRRSSTRPPGNSCGSSPAAPPA